MSTNVTTTVARRRIGRTSLEVSVMGLGAAPLGGLYRPSSQADADATIDAAQSAGLTHIDVAPHYGQGLAEQRVGRSLGRSGRDNFTLSTKVGRLLVPGSAEVSVKNFPEALPFATVYDATADGIRRSLDESIVRLGGRAPDMLLLHDPDRYAEGAALRSLIESAHAALLSLKREGRVAAIGLGVNAPEPCRMALEVGDWDCFLLAGSYSVLRQDDEGVLDACLAKGVSVLIGGPYMSGALAGGSTWRYRPIPDAIARDIEQLRAVCAQHDVPIEAVALQYPLQHPAVASVVVGMRSADEVRQNVSHLRAIIPDLLWDELRALGYAKRPRQGASA